MLVCVNGSIVKTLKSNFLHNKQNNNALRKLSSSETQATPFITHARMTLSLLVDRLEDRQSFDREFEHPKFSSEQYIKFRLKVNDEEYDEHIAYTEMLSFVEENFLQPEDGAVWTMRRIITHSRLHPDDPRMYDEKGRRRFDKNCNAFVQLRWIWSCPVSRRNFTQFAFRFRTVFSK